MTSQTGKQTMKIYILADISNGKCYQTMKFGQLIEYNMRNFSSKIMQKMRQVDQFQTSLIFKKVLYEIKANYQHFSFNIFWQSSTWTYNKK